MSLIDWSDPEEMLELLREYVADERRIARDDRDRRRFLSDLKDELEELAEEFADQPLSEAIEKLRAILESQPGEFAGDEVLSHVSDCIDELERIGRQAGG